MGQKPRIPSKLENAFIDLVIEMSTNDSEVARRAWPDMARPVRKLQHITAKQGKRKRQYVRLEDAYRISIGLEVEFPLLMLAAYQKMKKQAEEKVVLEAKKKVH